MFLAIYRRKSHASAGRELGVDATTIGRRLGALERALGARLFDRTPSGLSPTEAGAALFTRAERIEAEVLASERELRGADARLTGTVRVTAGDGLVHYVLIPALAELQRAHPGIALELRADTRALDLSRREADVAVRLSRPREPALVARRLGVMRFGLYASRAYLDRHGSLRRESDLANHAFIGFEAALDDMVQMRWLGRTVRDLRWALRANTTTAQVVACAEGLGIGLLPTFTAASDPRLVPILPRLACPSREAWIVVHEDVRRNARVEAVVTWIAGAARLS
ncbi:LysR family transcriptional regulator [Polyangium aurulentum]|nr:LysR family transcriptional regulator [Polyangium aurulentum]